MRRSRNWPLFGHVIVNQEFSFQSLQGFIMGGSFSLGVVEFIQFNIYFPSYFPNSKIIIKTIENVKFHQTTVNTLVMKILQIPLHGLKCRLAWNTRNYFPNRFYYSTNLIVFRWVRRVVRAALCVINPKLIDNKSDPVKTTFMLTNLSVGFN